MPYVSISSVASESNMLRTSTAVIDGLLLHICAATAATCGAAALVPGKYQLLLYNSPNSPAPLMLTSSTPHISGFCLWDATGYAIVTGPSEEKYLTSSWFSSKEDIAATAITGGTAGCPNIESSVTRFVLSIIASVELKKNSSKVLVAARPS